MKEEGKRNKTKCLLYVAAFVVFQTAIILVFALFVMRVKSPKLRFGTATVGNFSTTGANNLPSFDLEAQVTVKNTNFGHFKYENSTLIILYGEFPVGEVAVLKGRTRAKQTKKFDVVVAVSSSRLSSNPNFQNDINTGVLRLSSEGKLSGKVELMKVIKRKKSAEMSCTMEINLATKAVQDLKCK
ncbi:hypothetical protein SLEP1_g32956 [Rubroshorea leprosula]|uniref:Late embryogenesis abundant protein LEA-2 subgroup domain-containing protein n=1 Tax=Rubroshorea leprosula TaxID=152421 RepID=A0AAV5KF35_9ROSI|nr:hypothetical protein SLEP1_g32956 [Rubroshorea leprosula]